MEAEPLAERARKDTQPPAQILGPASTKAAAARAISFGDGAPAPAAPAAAPAQPARRGEEEAMVQRLVAYLRHHLMARVAAAAAAGGSGATSGADEDAEHRSGHDERSVCSALAARILGAEGLMLLMDAGADVDDDTIVGLAAEMLEAEARRTLRAARADPGREVGGDADATDGGAWLLPHTRDVRTAPARGALGGEAPERDGALERLVLGLLAGAPRPRSTVQ